MCQSIHNDSKSSQICNEKEAPGSKLLLRQRNFAFKNWLSKRTVWWTIQKWECRRCKIFSSDYWHIADPGSYPGSGVGCQWTATSLWAPPRPWECKLSLSHQCHHPTGGSSDHSSVYLPTPSMHQRPHSRHSEANWTGYDTILGFHCIFLLHWCGWAYHHT